MKKLIVIRERNSNITKYYIFDTGSKFAVEIPEFVYNNFCKVADDIEALRQSLPALSDHTSYVDEFILNAQGMLLKIRQYLVGEAPSYLNIRDSQTFIVDTVFNDLDNMEPDIKRRIEGK